MKANLEDNDCDSEGHVISTTQCNIFGDFFSKLKIKLQNFEFPTAVLEKIRVFFKLFVPCIFSAYEMKNQQMSLFQFYSYIDGSLHVSGLQAHLQESSHSCSHNHWFSICTVLVACSYTEHATRTVQTLNQWLCEQLCELS